MTRRGRQGTTAERRRESGPLLARAASSRSEFLTSRLQIPRGPRSALERPRISDALGNREAGVVLVVAPAGYGKTAAVAQWATTSPERIAWLSLDAGDNESEAFWASLAEALKRADPALADTTPPAERPEGERAHATPDAVAAPMLNRLAALDHEIVLVLDDYHEIRASDGHAALAHLLARRPRQLRVVVCSRSRPPIELGRLRSSGDLIELGVEQLAFTRVETGSFLNDVLRLDLAETAVDRLHERTEGWAAGVFLASLSMATAADRDQQVAAFGAANRHVADYLAEEVLASAGEQRRAFLLHTSILERLSAEVCDGTTFRHDSRGMLAEIVAANLFLLPLDRGDRWFRYHPLFREYLLAELHRAEPEIVAELYGRASDWHAAAGSADEAVRYAIRAGDVPRATTLIGERWLDEVNAGRFRTVDTWLSEMPPDVVSGDVGLSMIRAWVARLLDLPLAADAAMADAERGSPTGNFPLGATSFEASVALIRAAFPGGDAGGMLEAARTAYELETDPASPCHGTAGMLLGWALRLNGDTPSARRLFAESATLTMRAGQWFDAYGARAGLAWCSLDDGNLDQAERWARDAVEIAREHDLVSTPHGFLGDIALGAVLSARGRYDEADRLLANALDLGRLSEPFVRIQALLALAPVRNARLGPRAARTVLAEARALLSDCTNAGILAVRARDVARSITPAYRYVDTNTQLTQRELDVLRSLGEGQTKREIASTLFLSFNTIHSHTRTIYRKLGVSSRPEALEVARLRGLLEGETVTAAGQLA